MLRKYFISTGRYLWRHCLFTILNIFGLAVSISAAWIIYRIVDFEFSYDHNIPGKEKIYRVVTGFIFDQKESYNGGVSAPLYQGLRTEASGIRYVVPVLGKWCNSIEIDNPDSKQLVFDQGEDNYLDIAATDSSYFGMIPYHWLIGNPNTALKAPDQVVLTESLAKKFFPGKTPELILNKRIRYCTQRDTIIRTVTGILSELPAPTEFRTQEFVSLSTKPYSLNSWTNTNGSDKLYLEFNPTTRPENVLGQIESIVRRKTDEFEKSSSNHFNFKRWFQMLPLKESHFSTYIEEYGTRKASKPVLYGLVGIGLFLLILACINYINMSVAAMPQRAKEIGVRKTLGSSQGQLILQFLTETFFTTLIAAVLAQLLIWIGFWFLKDIIPLGVTPFTNIWLFIIFNSLLSGFITILAGFYPAWLITRIRTIQVFRNLVFVPGRARNFSLHKVLIVFQFVISIVFITSALIVGYQLHYALSTDMGFNKDAVILVEVPWKFINDKNYDNRQFPLFDNLKKLPGISDLSLGSAPMSSNYSSSEYEYLQDGTPPIRRNVFKKWVDTNYIRVYGIKLLAGRNLRACDTSNELVINETAVLDFGFKSPQDAIGKFIGPQQETKLPIVGVVKDFHLQNFYTSIDPMSLESEKDNLSNFNIKLEGIDPSRWQNIIREIERNWNQFYPSGSFSYKFYDVTIQAMYEQERHLSKLINLATGIAIIISCLGLFGLAVLTAYQRTKEIGIRKVLGASVSVIVQLLSKEYIQLVFISLLISSPIAWWAMTKWLQHFAYRIPLSWWLFVAAGFAGLVIAFLTVGFQAFKAARANPVESLRTE